MSGPSRCFRRFGLTVLIALLTPALDGADAVAGPPHRVVSLAPSLTEMVFALGAGNALVGDTTYCDFPEAARRRPKVGAMEDGSIDLERVLALKPDLVVAIGEGQQTSVDSLRRLGLRVEVVPSQTYDDVFDAITRMGRLLGREAEAKRLMAELERRIDVKNFAVFGVSTKRFPTSCREAYEQICRASGVAPS